MAKRGRDRNRVDQGRGWELIRAPGASTPGTRGKGPLPRTRSAPPGEQRLTVKEERRPQGRVVTVVRGLQLTAKDLAALAKELKAHCGAGGKASDGAVEVQGRHAPKLAAFLADAGYQVR